ncbi:MAG: COX15/CtaA family protein [Bacteroidia bacterium]
MKSSNKKIILWLFTGCFLIFVMVIIGGVTRLTGSGLSITEWKLIRGTIPPLNAQQWNEEFENYKKIPQYSEQNYHFTVEDFKTIYWWEYIHRLIGRIIGIVFIIPFLFFWLTKQLDKALIKKLLFLFLLGGLQGFLGWYMVKSGLIQNVRVSHIRLAIHLVTAFITFGFTFWVMLDLIYPRKIKNENSVKSIRKGIVIILILVLLQIIYGAFTAGLKAGHIYNTFPKMGDEWIAGAVIYGLQADGISALINNISVVQFIHRCIAWLLALVIIYFWFYGRKKFNTSNQKAAINYLMVAVLVQFWLGVFTLIYNVPIVLGVMHQAGAFFLFTATIYFIHSVSAATSSIATATSH